MPNQITARCIRFYELGGPEVLKIEPYKIPETPSGHVRVEVKAIGLNRADVMFRRGTYIEKAELPSRLGYEASGLVDETGDGVKIISDAQLKKHAASQLMAHDRTDILRDLFSHPSHLV